MLSSALMESPTPLVSIIIPVFEQAEMTVRCLESVARTRLAIGASETIVIDDASSPETFERLSAIPGIELLRNPENLGFLLSCNRAIERARSTYICFLNNDTICQDEWLDHLVQTMEADPSIGAVGSKLVYPDGKLQEAGGILFRDASGWNYGRNEDPLDPLFNFVRDVDYCSGAALLVRADVLRKLGNGFDTRYAPAYYEDADLCVAIRQLGYRVVYQPRSVVVHLEGMSSGTDLTSGAKRYQVLNREKFVEKWASVLATYPPNDPNGVYAAARRHMGARAVLIVDSSVPTYDKDAGSFRMMHIVRLFVEAGYRVVFHSVSYAPLQPYTHELQALGVEVLYETPGGPKPEERLTQVFQTIDLAWICRPDIGPQYISWIRQFANVKIVYDTIDLHFLRMRRQFELEGRVDDDSWQAMREIELTCARASDATIAVTEKEKFLLRVCGIERVFVVPTIHEMSPRRVNAFEDTEGVAFIGSYGHPPNVDAALWLAREIMPLVWQTDPSIRLTLLGNAPPDELLALTADERIDVPGFVRDVEPYFTSHRMFVAPLRFGAGINGRIGQALSYGLPVITTPLGADGFRLRDGIGALIRSDAGGLAEAILMLNIDAGLWRALSRYSERSLANVSRDRAKHEITLLACELLENRQS